MEKHQITVDERRITFSEANEIATITYNITYEQYIALKIRQYMMRTIGEVNPQTSVIIAYTHDITDLLKGIQSSHLHIHKDIISIIDDIRRDYIEYISRKINFNAVPHVKKYEVNPKELSIMHGD